MISIKKLAFSYRDDPVLKKLDLNLKTGLVHGILGSNGSGKTTLLNVLAGELRSNSGEIRWQGERLSHQTLAYLKADMHFYPLLTGREHLKIYQFRNSAFNVEKWNELFSLPLDDLIDTYSTGMKKKLGLLTIICQDKPVVLLDEPFNNLDVDTNQLVAKLLKMMAAKGKLVLLTSHILEILTGMADYIHVLFEGKVQQKIAKKDFEEWQGTYRTEEIGKLLDQAQELL